MAETFCKIMKLLTKATRRKWARRIAIVSLLFLVLAGYAFTQLNFPYYTHEKLAEFQAQIGLHTAKEMGSVQIIGHRGSGLANVEAKSQRDRERKPIGNTRKAINGAIKAGVHWIEIDLRRTKDKTLVLFHDETVDGKTDGGGKVSELTDEELQSFRISVASGEPILTLEEFQEEFLEDLVDKEIGLILDIKQPGLKTPVRDWIQRAIEEQGLEPNKVVVFGEYEILKEYGGEGLRLGYTFTWKRKRNRLLYLFRQDTIIRRLQEIDAEFLVVPVTFTSKTLVDKAEKKGIETWTYGSDDKRDWDRVSGIGSKGLIVDYPASAIEHFYPDGDSRMKTEAEQVGADQPATAPESKPEGGKKSKPESEGRPQ
jgi:glycerophosphoryl diester phosphodiesterase